MAKQADNIRALLEHSVEVAGEKALQAVADEIEQSLHELTPKRTGRTAASWRQTRTAENEITIHTRLPDGNPARWILELDQGTADRPPTRFIAASIARGLEKARGG